MTGNELNSNSSFVFDRSNNYNMAVRVSGESDYLTVHEEVLLSRNFSIMFWAKIKENRYGQTIFDFGNGEKNGNIILYLADKTLKPVVTVYNGQEQVGIIYSDTPIALGRWSHYTVMMSGTELSLYVNANLIKLHQCTSILNDRPKVINYFGKSSWTSGDYAAADFDEIKIYNCSLSHPEILEDMLNTFSYIMEV